MKKFAATLLWIVLLLALAFMVISTVLSGLPEQISEIRVHHPMSDTSFRTWWVIGSAVCIGTALFCYRLINQALRPWPHYQLDPPAERKNRL